MGFEQEGPRGKGSPAWGAYEGAGPLSRSVSNPANATSNAHPLRQTKLARPGALMIDLGDGIEHLLCPLNPTLCFVCTAGSPGAASLHCRAANEHGLPRPDEAPQKAAQEIQK